MIRKLLCLCMMIAFAASASAQQPKWVDRFHALEQQADEYREQQNWLKLSDCMEQQKKLFYAQPEAERVEHFGSKELDGSFYYNLTCFSALAGKEKTALSAFEKYTSLAEDGKVEVDLIHISTDTDLTSIQNHKRFQNCMERMKPLGDYVAKLKKASSYTKGNAPEALRFRYQAPNDSNLVRLRQQFNLDSIAGAGDELSKIKNLMHWVHETIRHDGYSRNPEEKNALAMIELCRKENRGLNCRMLAQVLTEVYLSMGFKARFVTCMPRDLFGDCHVIATVYSCTLDKWLWVDPTFDAYVTDENGTMLSVSEVRRRLRNDEELRLNDYANWNNRRKETKENYLYNYMAKNLYYIACMEESRFNAETWEKGRSYRSYVLMPFKELDKEIDGIGREYIRFSDEQWFWQSPY